MSEECAADFNEITLQQIRQLIESYSGREDELALKTLDVVSGEVLFEQGDDADCMFWILSGKLEARSRQDDGSEQIIRTISHGSHIGEMGLLSNLKRSATISALESSRLLRLTINDIIKLASLDSNLLSGLNKVAATRWQSMFLRDCLRNLFDDLSFEVLHELQQQLEWMDLCNGDILFHEGDVADGMYIIISGRLRASIKIDDADEKIVGELGPADFVGEYALLTDEPRSATVYATRNTSVAKMSLELLDEYTSASPALMRKIAHTVITRQKKMMRSSVKEANQQLSFTLLKHGSVNDVSTFAAELASLLLVYGDTLVIDSAGFDEYFGQDGVANSALDTPIQPVITSRLHELEGRYRYIFFIADDIDSPWTRRAIGQSDRLLVVAQSDGSPALSDIETVSQQQTVPMRTDLVLLHLKQVEEPTSTLDWLQNRNIHSHYHVRYKDASHMARLARRLSGHAIGIVCSGGGARGYAQMGVYKAMLELDIPIDYIAGTSMGAITSSAIACGFEFDKCEELADWSTKIGIVDLTLPMASVAASKNVTKICQHSYGDRKIEDLWVPYFCISSNLTKAERVIHQRGILWRAVRASMSIPGVFLPVVEDGDVLVDGGVMDNFPVMLMGEMAETRRLIGVNVNPYIERSVSFDYDTSLSGWRILFNRLNPFSKKLRAPSVMGTILRSLDVNSMKNTKALDAHLEVSITPDIRKFTMNDYSKWRAISKCGYEASYSLLEEWKKKQTDLK